MVDPGRRRHGPPAGYISYLVMMIIASAGVMSTPRPLGHDSDVVEVDEFKTGLRREGLYFGVISFCRKFSVALAMWLIGIVLSQIGYTAGAVQTESTLLGIRLLYAEGVAFFLLLSVIGAYFLPMNRKRHEALKRPFAEGRRKEMG